MRWLIRAASVLLVAAPRVVSADPRTMVDLEPATIYIAPNGETRGTVATVGATWGFSAKRFVPYVGAAVGLLTVQARAGVSFLPNEFAESGLLVRAEVRPQLFLGHCIDPGLLGNVGVGYRWPLEHSYPGEPAGTAMYLLPTFDSGRGFITPKCPTTGGERQGTWLFGGTVALGIDW